MTVSRRKKPKPKPRRLGNEPRTPKTEEDAYAKAVRALVRSAFARVLPSLVELGYVRQDAGGKPLTPGQLVYKEQIRRVREAFGTAFEDGLVSRVVDKQVVRVAAFNARDTSRSLGVSRKSIATVSAKTVNRIRRENVALIKDIPKQMLLQMEQLFADSGSMRVETVAKSIAERFGVAESRADLIARDQTLKMNADFTEERHQAANISQYQWSTSQDDRVRPLHAELEGQVFSWEDPPVTNEDGEANNPGQDIQCRCVAIPIL